MADHRRVTRIRWFTIAVLTLLALAAFIVSTVVGPIDLGPRDVVTGLISPDSLTPTQRTVLWDLRLPMSVMALLVGMGLSLAGAQMQTILGNPLAEPFTLGVSAAAAFGGAAAIVLGIVVIDQPQFNLAATAWVAAIAATGLIVVASVVRGASAESMILLGIALVFLFQALLALMQYRATTEALQQIVFWTMGSLTRATWAGNLIMAVVLGISLPIFAVLSWRLTALRLGDARASAMGVNVARLRVVVLVIVSLIAATTVAFSGVIGFVGLVGPHIARTLVGEDQRYFVPASLASGALMLSAAHAVSLLIVPGVAIPIGIITALVGVPGFIAIVMSRRRSVW
ncbi:FecCD family ABC transporter permease [Corynebacterium pygosceleis]|uniref:Iron ABC transporter permease n=1 Tax=Corynebacterium pygosceleis TaxID=2800406 RepID=A0A9Q4GJ87_9CORY|nr:iron ABC transporter permease [Corynebacterium pygosceleis]MCK7638467.1 iron ABC transporter permease [Corynebacterium pygosceleis]MCK7675447.1 iron ABC transporter permease [Corynebacterium pygosceleis]MCL0121159.1 iron ABC transporter permease [Corynebacterium pygosceleis]MCX7445373.1 iron ABC transporter permease [Corynebacterium pygosceleis]MCX7469131.1 iron ABC transporter permease [Corynebacterium pygosceleis]